MSLVIFCLPCSFVDYVPVKGEIIRYLSLTAWLISLSIMLSSSIHAVAKGISSFFLSAGERSIGATIKDTRTKSRGGWRWGREVGLARVGWKEGEKMQTIVTE